MIPAKPTEFKIGLFSDLARWRAFVAIAELGSLTRASLFLDCNQSLLSRQLNVLERDCGGRLFNRTGRGMELSELGEQLFPRVKALLSDADQLEQDIRGEAHEPAGRVTLGVLPSISQTLTRPLFARLRQHWPQIKLKILEGSSGQVEEWLADARVDIAILYRYSHALSDQEQALAALEPYKTIFPAALQARMRAKLGLAEEEPGDAGLVDSTFKLLACAAVVLGGAWKLLTLDPSGSIISVTIEWGLWLSLAAYAGLASSSPKMSGSISS